MRSMSPVVASLFLAAAVLVGSRVPIAAAQTGGDVCFVAVVPPANDGDSALSQTICLNTTTFAVTSIDAATDEEIDAARAGLRLDVGQSDVDNVWLLVAAVLVFFMQCGFAMLEAGSVSEKNVSNIIYKNFMDASIASIVFYLFGYAFAYGNADDNAFIGGGNFALSEEDGTAYAGWFFQFAFAATAATIVSGSVAERCKIEAYYAYSTVMIFLIYPVAVHWVWDTEGWLSAFNENRIGNNGMIDFAGSGVVHMVGGFAGLVAAIILGPRDGRFKDGEVVSFRPHSVLLQALGTFILWVGWYGFNAGSTLAAQGGASEIAGRVAVTTTLSAGAAGLTSAVCGSWIAKSKDPSLIFNGVLGGLVSITAGCATIPPSLSVVTGIIGGLVYFLLSWTLQKLQIDDPLDAFPVHGGCGFWGVLAVGIFSRRAEIENAYGFDNDNVASGMQLGVQLLGAVAIAAWTLVTSVVMFTVIKRTVGFRVDLETERKGLDMMEHGGRAYTRHVTKKNVLAGVEMSRKSIAASFKSKVSGNKDFDAIDEHSDDAVKEKGGAGDVVAKGAGDVAAKDVDFVAEEGIEKSQSLAAAEHVTADN